MNLSTNWLSEGVFDLEHKQYLLLAYLQQTHENFNQKILYPHITDLYNHYISSLTFKGNLNEIKNRQRKIIGFDIINEKIIYEEYTDEVTQDIETLLNFSIPKIEKEVEFGGVVYKEIKENIVVEKVGLISVNNDYGILILKQKKEFWLYEYEMEKILKNIGAGREMKTTFLRKIKASISNNPESIKERYQDEKKYLVNAYFSRCEEPLDIDGTMLPMTKEIIAILT